MSMRFNIQTRSQHKSKQIYFYTKWKDTNLWSPTKENLRKQDFFFFMRFENFK